MSTPARPARSALLLTLALLLAQASPAQTLRERLRERLQGHSAEADVGELSDLGGSVGAGAQSCADWAQRVNRLQERAVSRHPGPTPDMADLAYGDQRLQRLDVFKARTTGDTAAPVIVMVHGGGWCVGDKAVPAVTEHKVARWTPRGFIVVSVNYPMVADGSDALAQARHVAQAVAYVQAHAPDWGGDPARVILMGHSAGAHLVSLVNASPALRAAAGVKPVLGTVSLDAGAIDVVKQMPQVYAFLKTRYLEAFGKTESSWIAASPYHQLGAGASPWLGVCSTQRKDKPCDQARDYAAKSRSLNILASVLPEAKNHGAINQELGLPGPYTDSVERFMAGLDPSVAGLLERRPR
ncbi:MAG: esterase [Roseateles depolymerans]|uniref:Esterase n=1 Tax=Roseateles depolymerans TaxID=76731 RepID=A0A2W5DIE6_9BURK|nr:MAG: esterase [Roseateles depolymerans]